MILFVGLNSVILCMFTGLYSTASKDFSSTTSPFNPLYLAAITQSGVGYGDVVPKTSWAQMMVTAHIALTWIVLAFVTTS